MNFAIIIKPIGCPTGAELPPIGFDNFDLASLFVGVLQGSQPIGLLLDKVAELVANPAAVGAMKAMVTACLGVPA